MIFYVGLHQPSDAKHFSNSFISVNRLRRYKTPERFNTINNWIMDSGAFTEVSTYGTYRYPVTEYAKEIRRWLSIGRLQAVVSQDYMCEPWILDKTGLTVIEHQYLTLSRYIDLLNEELPVLILPVLQGYTVEDYLNHIELYGEVLTEGSWVGVGSVCKRNSKPTEILSILSSIKTKRPDLRLHGFGIKQTSLLNPDIQNLLYSADSMAWSFAARYEGRNQNDWREAKSYEEKVNNILV